MDVCLRPFCDVERHDGGFVATSTEPWLAIELPRLANLAGRFIELTYRASFWDEPVRPVFRFRCDDETSVDRIAAGPVVGAGLWIGRVPIGTRRIEVSPTNRLGRFDFRIERIRRRSWLMLICRAFRDCPKAARSAVLTRLIGWRPESDVNLAWATSATPVSRFARWYAARARSIDLAGLDRPRHDWTETGPIRIVIGDGDASATRLTLASLRAQVFSAWTVDAAAAEPKGALTCWLRPGDSLLPGALAYVAEQAHRHPSCRIFYGDAILIDERGAAAPAFQPGGSPRLFAAQPPHDALVVVRDLNAWPDDARRRFRENGQVPRAVWTGSEALDTRPLRRLLVERRRMAACSITAACRPPEAKATASVIIPTRDHPALLRRVVESIRRRRGSCEVQVVVVDNGSVTTTARSLLGDLARDPSVVCLRRPGPFNYSAICNAAAAAASGDALVFLNDDTEVLTDGWLDRLVAHALEPAIGAVGAKLTYPDGRLQHIGVLAGMGESAGHFGARAPGGDAGWAGRNAVLHEVSAVTGACLAVARCKFEAVGGFDAEHLPVELSDVDLCLKLNARGWQTVVDPGVHLMHEESTSRGGATFRRLDVYARQRAIFVERWRHVLRDDPVFHPGLSLYSSRAALG